MIKTKCRLIQNAAAFRCCQQFCSLPSNDLAYRKNVDHAFDGTKMGAVNFFTVVCGKLVRLTIQNFSSLV
jgi:hypothetical protein